MNCKKIKKSPLVNIVFYNRACKFPKELNQLNRILCEITSIHCTFFTTAHIWAFLQRREPLLPEILVVKYYPFDSKRTDIGSRHGYIIAQCQKCRTKCLVRWLLEFVLIYFADKIFRSRPHSAILSVYGAVKLIDLRGRSRVLLFHISSIGAGQGRIRGIGKMT